MQEEQPAQKQEGHGAYGSFFVVANQGLLLTYSLGKDKGLYQRGGLYLLPLQRGSRSSVVIGVFWEEVPKPTFSCRTVIGPCCGAIQLPSETLELVIWVSQYYVTPLGWSLSVLAPGFLWDNRKQKTLQGVLSQWEQTKDKLIRGEKALELRPEIVLNKQQEDAFDAIFTASQSVSLLYGVTGSGKTEVYLKAAQKILAMGKNVLILVPEIALTPQMSARFRAVFGRDVALLHSGLCQTDYMRQWLKVYFQECRVVLGVRTAVFCPLANVGLIIVDEEHDSSYKSSEMPCVHARDVAVYRASRTGARCILGSATPSLESFYNVQQNRYALITLTQRFSGHAVPYQVIDARPLFARKRTTARFVKSSGVHFENEVLSPTILESLQETKDAGHQSLVLVNRRGFVNYALCLACANPLSCPQCAVTTTLHKQGTLEICHYCGFQTACRTRCPTCGQEDFVFQGLGTQHLELALQQQLPTLRVARLDRDVFTSNTRLTQILSDFREGHTDCLVGTQLLAKGHDFPKVTLVVVLHVEDALFLPDFRAPERTFQLITQAMGRAGRGKVAGRVVLQSFVLDHPLVEMALQGRVDDFLVRELAQRKRAWMPPWSRLIVLEITHAKQSVAQTQSSKIAQILLSYWELKKLPKEHIRLAGPTPASIEKINNQYRFQICIYSARQHHPKTLFPEDFRKQVEFSGTCRVDVDPLTFL